MSSTEDEFKEAVKARYDFSSWAGKVRSPRSGLVANYLSPSNALKSWTLVSREEVTPFFKGNRTARFTYAGVAPAVKARLLLTVTESDSVMDAHESLIDTLMTYMAPRLPTCGSLGLEIGDVCFGCHGSLQTSVIFARFNLLVSVDSIGPEDVSIGTVAKDVDSAIAGEPVSDETPKAVAPLISTFLLSSETSPVNGEIVLTIQASDQGNRNIMTKILATGGSLIKRKDQYIYIAKETGTHDISLFIVNEAGLVSSRARQITVT